MELAARMLERESVQRWLRDATVYASFVASWGFVGGVVTYFLAAAYEVAAARPVNRVRVAEEGAFVAGFIALAVVVFVQP